MRRPRTEEMMTLLQADKTMLIQIPALAWIKENGVWKRIIFDGEKKEITIEDKRALKYFAFKISKIKVNNVVLERLKEFYKDVYFMRTDPFEALVITILSQGRTAEQTRRAFYNLCKIVDEMAPEGILKVGEEKIKNAIKCAGPYKAKYLIKVSQKLLSIDLEKLSNLSSLELLKFFLRLPGVGIKTAACVLVYSYLRSDVFPIDTHFFRVSNRLGILKINKIPTRLEGYLKILEKGRKLGEIGYAHLLLVMFGKEICKKRNPKCSVCPVKDFCSMV